MSDARSSSSTMTICSGPLGMPQVATMESEAELPGLESMSVMVEIQSLFSSWIREKSNAPDELPQQLWSKWDRNLGRNNDGSMSTTFPMPFYHRSVGKYHHFIEMHTTTHKILLRYAAMATCLREDLLVASLHLRSHSVATP